MRGRKYVLTLAVALTFVLGPILAAVPEVKAAPGPVKLTAKYRSTQDPYIPGQPVNYWVWCIVDIESPYTWDLTRDGIVGWDFDVHVDPTVLTVFGAYGATFGYFLFDFIDWNMLGTAHSPSILVGSVNAATGDIIDISEFIMGYGFPEVDPALLDDAAGGNSTDDWWYGGAGMGGYGLCRLRYRSKSATDSTSIDISDAAYWTMDPVDGHGVRNPIPDSDITDGQYNPEVPEFPLGAAMEVGLIVAVAYIWWTRRRKLTEVP